MRNLGTKPSPSAKKYYYQSDELTILFIKYNYQTISMFNAERHNELEARSHIRGTLNKQFYEVEQNEAEQKRQQMRQILDEQVREKQKMKEKKLKAMK